jgi:hypothetical protein
MVILIGNNTISSIRQGASVIDDTLGFCSKKLLEGPFLDDWNNFLDCRLRISVSAPTNKNQETLRSKSGIGWEVCTKSALFSKISQDVTRSSFA